MVSYAVKNGFLPPVDTLTCVDCGDPATDYDHRNYDYPISVDATCHRCNLKRGKASGNHDKSRKPFYRVLVDKKERDAAVKAAKSQDLSLSQYVRKAVRVAVAKDATA